ncbi:hypothetical protein TNCT_11261 [Trichonephila clavata]|uniref:Uncharacterized protein n=1 Tax=Trichonephila clavata TaxID=2740835 RepID=A0A8X6JPB2_TRICU|nr:hypothetical protein TNCT_11261 [Trichonephila clavata]
MYHLPAKYATHADSITATIVRTIVDIFHVHFLLQFFRMWNLDEAIAAEAENAEVVALKGLLPPVGGAVGG